MTAALDPAAFARLVAARAAGRSRLVVALAGPPGAGKSTIAEAVADELNREAPDTCAILPMDGFHYDDTLLGPLGWLSRKGAPHTFDVGGLAATLARLRRHDEEAVAVPVFDRAIEIARAGARLIPRTTRVVLVEGNYLLLDRAPWRSLAPIFELTAMVRVPEPVLRARLTARWTGLGLSPSDLERKVEANDMPNGSLVMAESRVPDCWIDGTA